MSKIISKDELMARWAYGELSSERFSNSYPQWPETNDIRQKAVAGVPFHDLSADERGLLIMMLKNSERSRPYGGLVRGLANIKAFRLERWSKTQIRNTRLVPGLGWQVMGDFYDGISKINPASLQQKDPRREIAILPNDAAYMTSEPVCVLPYRTGKYGKFMLLLEGTKRSLAFLKLAKEDATIEVWVPTLCGPKVVKPD